MSVPIRIRSCFLGSASRIPASDLRAMQERGYNAIHVACETNHPHVIPALVRMGVDESAVNDDGLTPWDLSLRLENALALLSLIAVAQEKFCVSQSRN